MGKNFHSTQPQRPSRDPKHISWKGGTQESKEVTKATLGQGMDSSSRPPSPSGRSPASSAFLCARTLLRQSRRTSDHLCQGLNIPCFQRKLLLDVALRRQGVETKNDSRF